MIEDTKSSTHITVKFFYEARVLSITMIQNIQLSNSHSVDLIIDNNIIRGMSLCNNIARWLFTSCVHVQCVHIIELCM